MNRRISFGIAGLLYVLSLAAFAQTNLLVNGGFENGNTSGWTTWGSTLQATNAAARSGSFGGRISNRTTTWQTAVRDLLPLVTAGQPYQLDTWVRPAAGASVTIALVLQQTDTNGVTYQTVASQVCPAGVWTELTGGFIYTPAGAATGLNLYLDCSDATRVLDLDDWSMTATLSANLLAFRSNGTLRAPSAWRLDYNGFLGTFINVTGASPAAVNFTVAASKSSNDSGTPQLRLRVADFNQTWDVTAIGNSYANYSQTWMLPPGTYAVRLEYINHAQSLQLNIASLTVSNATMLNTASDSNALAAADTYIANFRQGPVTVTVVNPNGQPLTNTTVRFKLQRHAFNFGTAVYGVTAGDGPWISGSGVNEVNYRNFLNQNFNSIEPENAGKWPWNEAVSNVVTMGFVDQIRNYAAANNQRVRMHGVLWGADQPAWVNNLIYTATNSASTLAQKQAATNSLRQAISRRIQYFLVQTNRAAGYGELDGINESVHQDIYTQIYGLAGVAGINNEIKQALNSIGAPTKNFVNEYAVLQWSADAYANWYLQHIESVRTNGATNSINGIGVQYYVDLSSAADQSSPHSPSRMRSVFDNLSAESTPLSLTEYGCLTTNATAQRVATTLSETVRVVFGHDQMNTFNLWGFWQPVMWASGGPLVDANWNLTLSGQTWQQMMGVTNWGLAGVPMWTTDVTLTTDAQGKASFTGFYGDYIASSGYWQQNFTVTKGANNNLSLTNGPVGTFYLTYGGNSLGLFTESGFLLRNVATNLSNPQGVAVDGAGNVFVSDYGNHAIRMYDAAGNFVRYAMDSSYSGNSQPFGLAINNDGNLLALVGFPNLNLAQVLRLNPSKTLTANDAQGAILAYNNVGLGYVGAAYASANNTLYVSSLGAGGIAQTFDGSSVAYTGNITSGGLGDVRGLARNPATGDLFVGTYSSGKVIRITGGVPSDYLTSFIGVAGVALEGGAFWVVDNVGGRVSRYEISGLSAVWQGGFNLAAPAYLARGPAVNVAPGVIPALTVQVVGGQLRLAWPANAPGFTLLSSSSLTGGWITNTAPVTIESGGFVVYQSPSATVKFYRLIK